MKKPSQKRRFKRFKKKPFSRMKQTKMLVFPNDKIDRIMNLVGIKVEGNQLKYRGRVLKCEGCKTLIEKKHLGSVMAHSEHFFCDNPACFSTFVRKFKLKE